MPNPIGVGHHARRVQTRAASGLPRGHSFSHKPFSRRPSELSWLAWLFCPRFASALMTRLVHRPWWSCRIQLRRCSFWFLLDRSAVVTFITRLGITSKTNLKASCRPWVRLQLKIPDPACPLSRHLQSNVDPDLPNNRTRYVF